MNKCYFFKNCTNYNSLLSKTNEKYGSINYQCYKVIRVIDFDKNDYESFANKFLYNYDFLFEFINLMKVENGIWNSILIKNTIDDAQSIIVCNNGYMYPAFTALPNMF